MSDKPQTRETVYKPITTLPPSKTVSFFLITPAIIQNLRHEVTPTTLLTYNETLSADLLTLVPNFTTRGRCSHMRLETLESETSVPHAMGASREIETQYTPTAAPNASATSATYVLLPMGTFMELKTQETPTQAPYTPATNTTKILQRDD
jgi:hypothetical protein